LHCFCIARGNLAYSASKGAINQLTRELAVEWARYRIRVNALLPCQFRTPAVQPLLESNRLDSRAILQRILDSIPMQRLGEPEELVGPVIFLASDASAFVTGGIVACRWRQSGVKCGRLTRVVRSTKRV